MFKTKSKKNQGKETAKKGRGIQTKSSNQRSDYHTQHEAVSSGDETDDLLIYEWSGVISIYYNHEEAFESVSAEIDTNHMKTETKGPRGRPLQKWDFIFSPDKFDAEIGLS